MNAIISLRGEFIESRHSGLTMEFFLDTADVDEIREIAAWGILDGVTTNPSLIKKSGRDFKEVVREIAGICSGPISAEVTAMDTEGMVTPKVAL